VDNDARPFLRRLIPFPGAEAMTALPVLSAARGIGPSPSAADAPSAAAQQVATIVSQAASILDEEMARGVLAASRAGAAPSRGYGDPATPLMRQVHELVDNIATMWSRMEKAQTTPYRSPQSTVSNDEPLADVRPRAAVKPGQRATISMSMSNSENRPVRLVAAATDLLGSNGGRIASSLLEFTPAELSLEPGEQRDIVIATIVPPETTPGCYSGLLVVRGVDYLRALITIEVL
jgi:hypothetical protein